MVGEEDLFHLDLVVKLKKFPFCLMKIEVSWDDDIGKSVYLPLLYWNFLRRGELDQEEFDKYFGGSTESVIKSKVFSLVKILINIELEGGKGFEVIGSYFGLQFSKR